MNISVVMPNFNGEKLLKKNLPKILATLAQYRKGTCEIIVTDDSSKDDSVAYLKEFIKNNSSGVKVILLENNSGKNKGFSSNVNKGVNITKGNVVILLNTDVVPRRDFLEPLLERFKDSSVFAVGCMDESIEDGKIVLRGSGIGKWRRGFFIHGPGNVDKGVTLWVSGGSGAFRKELWDRLGGLNQLYNPFYWEDIDLSYRAQKAGYKVVFEKKSVVTHSHEEGSIKKNYKPFSVQKIAYRNQFYFTWLNATDRMILLSHIIFTPFILLKALMRKDLAFVFGFFMAMGNMSTVLRERERTQKLVVMSDGEVVSRFS